MGIDYYNKILNDVFEKEASNMGGISFVERFRKIGETLKEIKEVNRETEKWRNEQHEISKKMWTDIGYWLDWELKEHDAKVIRVKFVGTVVLVEIEFDMRNNNKKMELKYIITDLLKRKLEFDKIGIELYANIFYVFIHDIPPYGIETILERIGWAYNLMEVNEE